MTAAGLMWWWSMPKAEAEDILMRVTVRNRGPERAVIHVAPHFVSATTGAGSPARHFPASASRLEEPFWCGMWNSENWNAR